MAVAPDEGFIWAVNAYLILIIFVSGVMVRGINWRRRLKRMRLKGALRRAIVRVLFRDGYGSLILRFGIFFVFCAPYYSKYFFNQTWDFRLSQ
jgi:hypothetical protein